MSIPGGIDCPGAELVYRVGMMAPDPKTTVIVNCAGRTRSIIGAQSLINAGIANKVMALKDGTMGWQLAGLKCAHGERRHAPDPEGDALAAAAQSAENVAAKYGVSDITSQELAGWQAAPDRTTFLLDVRTEQEFRDGHWPGARHAPGGQLVQATDEYVGVRNARIVLADNPDRVRATMTASWLVQLGYREVRVLGERPEHPETGADNVQPPLFREFETITAEALRELSESGDTAVVVDLASSAQYKAQHIEGASWGVRARLAECVSEYGDDRTVVLTSPDGRLAHFAADDLAGQRPQLKILVLEGGTKSWIAKQFSTSSGMSNALTDVDDTWPKPYDQPERLREAMEEYLTWEVGLVEQVERDGLVEFRKFD